MWYECAICVICVTAGGFSPQNIIRGFREYCIWCNEYQSRVILCASFSRRDFFSALPLWGGIWCKWFPMRKSGKKDTGLRIFPGFLNLHQIILAPSDVHFLGRFELEFRVGSRPDAGELFFARLVVVREKRALHAFCRVH